MNELVADILPWFAAFYVLDAVMQLRRGQLVFTRGVASGFRVLRAGIHAVAFWPTDVAVLAHDLPFLPATDGVYVGDPDARAVSPVLRAESLRRVSWDALADVRAERSTVKAGRTVLFRARSPDAARAVVSDLVALRDTAPEKRPGEFARRLGAAFDVTEVQARWASVKTPLSVTNAFATAEAFLLFIGLPYVAFVSTAEDRWERALLGLLLLHAGTVVATAWTMRRSGASRTAISNTVLTLAIFPAFASRAGAAAIREAFLGWDPAAIGSVLLPRDSWLRAARRECVRLEASAEATRGLGLEAFWSARRQALDAMLVKAGTRRREVLATPDSFSADVSAYCPLCLAEYREHRPACSDCGIPLEPRIVEMGRIEAPTGTG